MIDDGDGLVGLDTLGYCLGMRHASYRIQEKVGQIDTVGLTSA